MKEQPPGFDWAMGKKLFRWKSTPIDDWDESMRSEFAMAVAWRHARASVFSILAAPLLLTAYPLVLAGHWLIGRAEKLSAQIDYLRYCKQLARDGGNDGK